MTPLHPRLTVPFMEGETVQSFVSRSAAILGRSARLFCRDVGLTFQRLLDGDTGSLRRLASLTRVDLATLETAAFVAEGDRRYSFRGQSFDRESLSRKVLRICPHCISEDLAREGLPPRSRAFGRAIWCIGAIRTCATHRVALVVVSEDDHPQRVHDFSQLIQPALERIEGLKANAIPREVSDLEQYLFGRLDGHVRGTWLDALPFHAAAKSCEVLGAVALFGPASKIGELGDEHLHQAGRAGFDILRRGPEGIRQFVRSSFDAHAAREKRIGFRKMFGRSHEWLTHEASEADYAPLMEAMNLAASEVLAIAEGAEAFGRQVETRQTHSIRSASLEFGVHPKRLRNLLHRAGVIDDAALALSDERVLISAEVAGPLAKRIATALNLAEVRAHLNLPRPLEQHLLKAGLLVPFIGGSKTTVDHAFDREEINGFLGKLMEGATETLPDDESMVPIVNAALRANTSGLQIVRLILEKKLQRVGLSPHERGFAALLVDPEEI